MPRPVSSPWTLTREDSDDRLAGPTSRFTSWIPTSSTLGVMSRMGFTIVRLCGTHWHGIGWALESSTSCVDFGFSDLRSCFPMSVSSFGSTTSSRTSSQSTGRLSWSPRGAGPSRCGSRLASLLVPHEPNELYESREQHPPVERALHSANVSSSTRVITSIRSPEFWPSSARIRSFLAEFWRFLTLLTPGILAV